VVTAPHITKTVLIERPIIAWDEVKSLTLDGTRETLRDNYAGVIYVSELHFDDGTIWKRENIKGSTAAQQIIGRELRERVLHDAFVDYSWRPRRPRQLL
jgi:hypothetical protein